MVSTTANTSTLKFGVDGVQNNADIKYLAFNCWTRAFSSDEVVALYVDPYAFLIPDEGEMPALLSGAPGAPSGTLAATEAPDVAAIVGTAGGATGTLTATGAPDVAAIVGTAGGATGTLAATEAQDIAAILGTAGGATER